MALKITSGAWIAANRENREIRNSKRQQTFDEAGVQPAPSMRDIHVPAKVRLERTVALFPMPLEAGSGTRTSPRSRNA